MLNEKIKSILLFSLIILLSVGFAFMRYPGESNFVASGEEDSEDSEGSEGNVGEEDEVKYETETVIVTPERTIYEEQIKTTYLPDKDRDGLADENDPHPDVAEIYVVLDEDRNGISDEYEKFFESIKIAK